MATSKKKKRKSRITTSKKIVAVILGFAIFDVQVYYILELLDRHPSSEVTVALIASVIGTVLGYYIKSFRENREEANMKLRRDREGLKEEEDELVN